MSEHLNKISETAKNITDGGSNGVNTNINAASRTRISPGDINAQILSGVADVRSMGITGVNSAETLMTTAANIANAGRELSDLIAKNINGLNNINNIQNSQIIQNIRNGAQNGFELKMKLFPEELGELFVKVAYNKGNISVNIIAENPTAEREILNQMENLRESLEAHEFNLSGFDVSSRNNPDGNGGGYGQNQNQNGAGRYINISGDSLAVSSAEEASRNREIVMNYLRSKRLVYKTI